MFQHGRIGAERNTVYRMLRLKVKPAPAGYEITGTFMYEGTDKLASAQKYTNRELTFRALLAQDRTQLLELTRG
jgi:hypothetical protein